MSLRGAVEQLLGAAGHKVARRSDSPPFVVVRYAGLADDDEALRRHAVRIWCCTTLDRDDPQELAAEVWGTLRASRTAIPVTIIGAPDTRPPGSQRNHDCAVIEAHSLT